MPIYTKEWSNYVANYKSLYTYGDIMGLIKPYDEELFKNIRNFYYNNIPAVMLLLDYDFAQGHCYERAKLLKYIFKDDDCTIITADIDHLRYNPIYIEKHINGELGDNYSEHCYIRRFEKDCRMWIYDTSLGYATVEVLYNSTTPNLSTFFEKGNLSNYSNSEIKSIIKEAKDMSEYNL